MVSRLAPFQHAFVQRLSELGIAYRGSPIVEGPGKRYFDDSMRGGKGILSRFLLLLDEGADSSTKEAAERLCASLKDIVELRWKPHHDIILVRPDGYIASLCTKPPRNRRSDLRAFTSGASNESRTGKSCGLRNFSSALYRGKGRTLAERSAVQLHCSAKLQAANGLNRTDLHSRIRDLFQVASHQAWQRRTKMKIFLAGATGAIGKRSLPMLVSAGHAVTATTQHPDKMRSIHTAGAIPMLVNALNKEEVLAAVEKTHPEIIIHN